MQDMIKNHMSLKNGEVLRINGIGNSFFLNEKFFYDLTSDQKASTIWKNFKTDKNVKTLTLDMFQNSLLEGRISIAHLNLRHFLEFPTTLEKS